MNSPGLNKDSSAPSKSAPRGGAASTKIPAGAPRISPPNPKPPAATMTPRVGSYRSFPIHSMPLSLLEDNMSKAMFSAGIPKITYSSQPGITPISEFSTRARRSMPTRLGGSARDELFAYSDENEMIIVAATAYLTGEDKRYNRRLFYDGSDSSDSDDSLHSSPRATDGAIHPAPSLRATGLGAPDPSLRATGQGRSDLSVLATVPVAIRLFLGL